MQREHIDRRTFLKGAIAFGAAGIGAYFGWDNWSSKRRWTAGRYRPTLGELFESDAVGAEILLIGSDYLKTLGDSKPNADDLLSKISGIDRTRLTGTETGLASRFRREVSKRISVELAQGDLLLLHGYFVPPTFGQFCAALALIVRT